jgi:hypothetical protein
MFGNRLVICVSSEYTGRLYLLIGILGLDSVEDADPRWIWLAGYAESWEKVPDRTS